MIKFIVAGSKYPKFYEVRCWTRTGQGNRWNCTCKSWAYRKKCKHQRTAEEALLAGVLSMEIE